MRKFRVTFFFLTVALALSGCGILGGSDGTDVTVAEDVAAQPTVNNVQSVPAQGSGSTTDGGEAGSADGALPTAVTLPTAAPTPEPTVDRSQPTTYIVQSGDVLGLIAERFDADIAELRRVNGLDGNLIRVGQELTIPALDAATAATSVPSSTTAPSGPVTCSSAATGHCVQPGESLLGIALKYDVTVEALRAANPGVSGDLIKSGEVLNLPSGSTSPTPAATSAPSSPDGTPVPTVTVGPLNDADCKAANPQFPYFHAADGLCYANPISATARTDRSRNRRQRHVSAWFLPMGRRPVLPNSWCDRHADCGTITRINPGISLLWFSALPHRLRGAEYWPMLARYRNYARGAANPLGNGRPSCV